jgi:hypothetical protein
VARLSVDTSNIAPMAIMPRATAQLRRVQSVNTTSDRPNTQVREVGNESIVGVTYERPNVTVALEANAVNARLLAIFANRDPDVTFSDITLQDLLGQCDVDLNLVQRDTSRTTWLRSVYIKQATLTSYRLAASTDAAATETFEFNADNKTAFERWVYVDRQTAASPAQTAWTLAETPVALTNGKNAGNKLISVFRADQDEPSEFYLEGAANDFTVSGTSVTFTATGAANIATGDNVVFTYQVEDVDAPVGDQFQAKDTISPAAIAGYYHIPVTLRVTSNTLFLRGAQSIEATMNLNTNVEVGMGSQAVGSERVIPAEVTGNFVIFEEGAATDLMLIEGDSASTVTDLPIDAYLSNIQINVDFKHPDTGTILRTDTLSGISISGDTKDVAVGQAVGKQYNFSAATDFGWYVDKLV